MQNELEDQYRFNQEGILCTVDFAKAFDSVFHSAIANVLEESKLPRNALMEQLQSKGISTRPGTHAVHMLEYYRREFGFAKNDFSNAARLNDHSLAIPLHNKMDQDDLSYVIESLKELL